MKRPDIFASQVLVNRFATGAANTGEIANWSFVPTLRREPRGGTPLGGKAGRATVAGDLENARRCIHGVAAGLAFHRQGRLGRWSVSGRDLRGRAS